MIKLFLLIQLLEQPNIDWTLIINVIEWANLIKKQTTYFLSKICVDVSWKFLSQSKKSPHEDQ